MYKATVGDSSDEKSEAHSGIKDARSEYCNHSRARSEDLLLILRLCNYNVSPVNCA